MGQAQIHSRNLNQMEIQKTIFRVFWGKRRNSLSRLSPRFLTFARRRPPPTRSGRKSGWAVERQKQEDVNLGAKILLPAQPGATIIPRKGEVEERGVRGKVPTQEKGGRVREKGTDRGEAILSTSTNCFKRNTPSDWLIHDGKKWKAAGLETRCQMLS